ncbi:MAG: RcpC/CpaB family pilus assembly protein [Chloroflexota bacterium]|nr:RcpC/CpaB family pilus assembly protein [Chloroflexota bacterium]
MIALLRERCSNEEIAKRLGISVGGVKYHVSEILGKLGVASRDEAAHWAHDQRGQRALIPPWTLLRRHVHRSAFAQFAGLASIACCVALVGALAWGVARTDPSSPGTLHNKRDDAVNSPVPVGTCTKPYPPSNGVGPNGQSYTADYPGLRAIAIEVRDEQSVRDMTPGDWVDVYIGGGAKFGSGPLTAESLATCAEVLVIRGAEQAAPIQGSTGALKDVPLNSVIIAVTPQVAGRLAAALNAGAIVRFEERNAVTAVSPVSGLD